MTTVTDLLQHPRYEVIPLSGTEEAVLEHVPTEVTVTITTSPAKGLEPTLSLTERLAEHGYRVVPHLAARHVRDRVHLAEIVDRMRATGASDALVLAGDAEVPAGEFDGALPLLRALAEAGQPFRDVGITGYPESHAVISDTATIKAMFEKEEFATYIVSQICFDPEVTAAWMRASGSAARACPSTSGFPVPSRVTSCCGCASGFASATRSSSCDPTRARSMGSSTRMQLCLGSRGALAPTHRHPISAASMSSRSMRSPKPSTGDSGISQPRAGATERSLMPVEVETVRSVEVPTRLVHGPGALARLGETLRELGVTRPLLVTDPGVVAAGLADRALEHLDGRGRLRRGPPEPGHRARRTRARGRYREPGCDGLVGLGGGSSMDTAKSIGVEVAHGGSIVDYEYGATPITQAHPAAGRDPDHGGHRQRGDALGGDHRPRAARSSSTSAARR